MLQPPSSLPSSSSNYEQQPTLKVISTDDYHNLFKKPLNTLTFDKFVVFYRDHTIFETKSTKYFDLNNNSDINKLVSNENITRSMTYRDNEHLLNNQRIEYDGKSVDTGNAEESVLHEFVPSNININLLQTPDKSYNTILATTSDYSKCKSLT